MKNKWIILGLCTLAILSLFFYRHDQEPSWADFLLGKSLLPHLDVPQGLKKNAFQEEIPSFEADLPSYLSSLWENAPSLELRKEEREHGQARLLLAQKEQAQEPVSFPRLSPSKEASSPSSEETFPEEAELNFPSKLEDETPSLPVEPSLSPPSPPKFHVIFDPLDRTVLSAEVPSPIEVITKKLGESFQQGDLLILLSNRHLKAIVQQAQVNWHKALAVLAAKRQLYQNRVAALMDVKTAEAEAAKAEAELTIALKNLKATEIYAPYSGKVVRNYLMEHELPEVNRPLIEIVNDTVLIARFLIPSQLWNQVFIGENLKIHVNETGQIVDAHVIRTGGIIDPASSTLIVEAEVDNRQGSIKAGMTGEVTLQEALPNVYYR